MICLPVSKKEGQGCKVGLLHDNMVFGGSIGHMSSESPTP